MCTSFKELLPKQNNSNGVPCPQQKGHIAVVFQQPLCSAQACVVKMVFSCCLAQRLATAVVLRRPRSHLILGVCSTTILVPSVVGRVLFVVRTCNHLQRSFVEQDQKFVIGALLVVGTHKFLVLSLHPLSHPPWCFTVLGYTLLEHALFVSHISNCGSSAAT